MKDRSQLKVLLLQIRDHQEVRKEELESFAFFSGLNISQFDVLNVFDREVFANHSADHYDALFIGGASEASVLAPDKYPFLKSSYKLIHQVIDKKIPTFASCFGYQMVVIALGGEIIRDEEDFEMGTIPISLTDSAKDDPLFSQIKNNFYAVSVHQERAIELPKDCHLLAYTTHSTHSFKIQDAPFWAFQFHPEVNKEILIQRLAVYKERYTESDEHFNEIARNFRETPESNSLVRLFVDKILVGQQYS